MEKGQLLKRNGKPIRLTIENLTFVDSYTYVDPNCSLDSYLKAWSKNSDNVSTAGKLTIFPYRWLTDTTKLLEKEFPKLSDFCPTINSQLPEADIDYSRTSRVMDKPIDEETYLKAKNFYDNNCSNMGDYLRYYNMQDVKPLFQCVQKHFDFFKRLKVSMWQDAHSIPGVSMKVAQSLADSNNNLKSIYLFGEEFKFLQDDLRENIAGGLALTMHRMLISNENRFDDCPETGEKGQICQSIEGFDASSQYLGCTASPMPCGPLHYYAINDSGNDSGITVQRSVMNAYASKNQNQLKVAI